MHYAILAYHVEGAITAMTPEEDAALMVELRKIDQRLTAEGKLGPAARLDYTQTACTLRDGLVIDGPFAETKEQLLGLYLVECRDARRGHPGRPRPCARSIPPPSTKSARSCSTFPARPSRHRRLRHPTPPAAPRRGWRLAMR